MLPVGDANYQVTDVQNGQALTSDMAPMYLEAGKIAERRSTASNRLIFEVDLPAVGFKVYNVVKGPLFSPVSPLPSLNNQFVLRNNHFELKFDTDGNLIEVGNLRHGIRSQIRQSFCYYIAMSGTNATPKDHSSGAYIFRPYPGRPPVCFKVMNYSISHLSRLTELHQVYNEWISQTIRVYDGAQHVEFEWQIGNK